MSFASTGRSTTIVASGLERPKGIAVRLDRIYVALSDGRILSLPR